MTPSTLAEQRTGPSGGKARVRLKDGKLYYSAGVELAGYWAHLTGAQRLTSHGDGYATVAAGDLTVPSRAVQWIRWERAA